MKTNKEIYEKLSQKYSDEDLVEGYFSPEVLDEKEQKEVDDEFRRLRAERLKNMSEQEILIGEILQMKFLLQSYFKSGAYKSTFSFANQLRRYIEITRKNNKEIAENLDIHPTKLSRILNEKENPNKELMYRLGVHSDGEIPAHYWWRLYSIQFEHQLRTDMEKKLNEEKKVKGQLDIRA